MTVVFHPIMLVAIVALAACEQPVSNSASKTNPTVVSGEELPQAVAEQTGLVLIDVSVPFERLAEAPGALRRIVEVLRSGSPGLYVMHYHDDTLRNTYHMFAVTESGSMYIRMTTMPAGGITREEFEINVAEYDEQDEALVMMTTIGRIRLLATDVTPVGA